MNVSDFIYFGLWSHTLCSALDAENNTYPRRGKAVLGILIPSFVVALQKRFRFVLVYLCDISIIWGIRFVMHDKIQRREKRKDFTTFVLWEKCKKHLLVNMFLFSFHFCQMIFGLVYTDPCTIRRCCVPVQGMCCIGCLGYSVARCIRVYISMISKYDTTHNFIRHFIYHLGPLLLTYLDSKVHGANMAPTWVLSAPDGTHVGPMNHAIRVD